MRTEIITSSFENNIKIDISGGSHESFMSIKITGMPAGISLSERKLQKFMNRRAPGQSDFTTRRKEEDIPEFQSGIDVVNGKCVTNGEAICAIIKNENIKYEDYADFTNTPRPSHADFTAKMKYQDSVNMSGGGPFSGRMTAMLCLAGGIALQALETKGVFIGGHLKSVGNATDVSFDPVMLTIDDLKSPGNKRFPVIDDAAGEDMKQEILKAINEHDSVGGIVEIAAIGLPAGLGGPMYDKVEAKLAQILFSIPAVKGIEFGNGFGSAALRGSKNNDSFCIVKKEVKTVSNNHGGILGGITSGMPIVCRAAFKPTPSIGIKQKTVNLKEMREVEIAIEGRHDPCVAVRGVAVTEAAIAIGIFDLMIKEF
ncbi:MAG: chorismate synthase [Eubacteriales bacterium]